jgi:ComF family protein
MYRFDYEKSPLITKAVHELKYNFIEEMAAPLGELLAQTLKENLTDEPEKNWVICPVPLHKKRRKWRGFNQAELLAKRLMEFGNVSNLLERSRYSKPQMELHRDERLKNVCGSFIYSADFLPENVLLVDDVATTLSTLNECAGVLKLAGVKTVIGLVLARAV